MLFEVGLALVVVGLLVRLIVYGAVQLDNELEGIAAEVGDESINGPLLAEFEAAELTITKAGSQEFFRLG